MSCDPPPVLELAQGTTWRWSFVVGADESSPLDLTGCSAVLSFRDAPGSATAWLTASTLNGLLSIDPGAGRIYADIPASTLAAIAPRTGVVILNITYSDGSVGGLPTMIARLHARKVNAT